MAKGPAWLLEELPELQREGVLDAATAERLRQRYAGVAASPGIGRWILAVLGAVLVGLGLILLAAHNWGDWSRDTRLAVSLLPLLLSQLLIAALLRRPDGASSWSEAAAAFSALAFTLAVAMVGQIFHLPGNAGSLLLTAALMTLPLVYLLDSALAAALAAAALFGAIASGTMPAGHPLLVVAAHALLLPHLLRLRRRGGAGFPLLTAALIPLFFFSVLASFPDSARLGLVWLAGFGALLVLLDRSWETRSTPLWRRPLSAYGSAGVAVAALIGSFADPWRHWLLREVPLQFSQAWLLLGTTLALVLVLAIAAARRRQWSAALFALPALMLGALAAFEVPSWASVLAWLLSATVLLMGLALLREGVRERHWGMASRGLFLITLLVLLRFMDTDWSFTARGVVFVSVGLAFIGTSLWLRRRIAT